MINIIILLPYYRYYYYYLHCITSLLNPIIIIIIIIITVLLLPLLNPSGIQVQYPGFWVLGFVIDRRDRACRYRLAWQVVDDEECCGGLIAHSKAAYLAVEACRYHSNCGSRA